MIFVQHERALKAPKTTSNKWLKKNKLKKNIHSMSTKTKSFEIHYIKILGMTLCLPYT